MIFKMLCDSDKGTDSRMDDLRVSRRRFVSVAASAAAAGVVLGIGGLSAWPAAAAAGAKQESKAVTFAIFRGELGNDANIHLGAWGSGSAEASKDAVLIGVNSIKVTTAGMYEGARLDFASPIDLGAAWANPHTYLRFQVRFSGQGTRSAAFDPESQQTTSKAVSPFRMMRYLLVMQDGSHYELVRPVELPPSEDPDSWAPLSFPLAALAKQFPGGKIPTGDAAKVKQLAIFGDRYAQFLIGEINVVTDETEINVAPLDDQIAFAQTPIAFVANAEGGTSTLRYSWDFDASDGIQEDAVGRTGYHVFPRANNGNSNNGGGGTKVYKITLTVSDVDGIKKPQSVTQELTVSD